MNDSTPHTPGGIGAEEPITLVTTNSRWMKSLIELAEKVIEERKKYEALMIEQNRLPEFHKLNHACACLAGFASSAKSIIKDNEPE